MPYKFLKSNINMGQQLDAKTIQYQISWFVQYLVHKMGVYDVMHILGLMNIWAELMHKTLGLLKKKMENIGFGICCLEVFLSADRL